MNELPIFIRVIAYKENDKYNLYTDDYVLIKLDEIIKISKNNDTWYILLTPYSDNARKTRLYFWNKVHPDSFPVMEQMFNNRLNFPRCNKISNVETLISELINELRFNPYVGSELNEVKKRFLQNLGKMKNEDYVLLPPDAANTTE